MFFVLDFNYSKLTSFRRYFSFSVELSNGVVQLWQEAMFTFMWVGSGDQI